MLRKAIGVFCLLALILAGCGTGRLPVSTVTGTVTCEGKPVRAGTIHFKPIGPGRQASGNIDENGNYQLSTYNPNDGAIIGKHEVVYSPPAIDDDEKGVSADLLMLKLCELPPNFTVEVKAEANTIDLKLNRKPKPKPTKK